MPTCPECPATHTVKNGHIPTGKHRYLCHQCGYQFVEHPTDNGILKKFTQSHQTAVELHPLLQRIITCLSGTT